MLGNFGIRAKIVVVLLAVFGLAMLIQAFFITPRIVRQSVERENTHQAEIAHQIAANLDSVFARARTKLESMATLPAISSLDKDQMDRYIRSYNTTDQLFNYYFVVDRNGRWLSYPSREELVGQTIPPQNIGWVDATFETNRTVFLDVVVSRVNTLVSGFSTPIPAGTGEPNALLRGVIVVSERNRALELVRETHVGENGYAYVVAASGRIVAHPRLPLEPGHFDEMDYSHFAPVKNVIEGRSGVMEYEYEDQMWVAAYYPIRTTGWGVVTHQPRANVSAAAQAHTRTIWLPFMIVTFLSIVLIGVVIQYALKPLTRLVRNIETGPVLTGKTAWSRDEIGRLGKRFEELYATLARSQDVLQESEDRFRSLVETTSDWIWQVDRDGVYTYSSPKIKDLLGYESHEVLGKTPFSLMIPEEAKHAETVFFRAAESRKPFAGVENMNRHKNGRIVILESSGVPVFDDTGDFQGYRGIDRDITESKQATKALRESEERLDLGMSVANDGMWDWDLMTNIVYFDPRYYMMAGYEPHEFPGTFDGWAERVHPEDFPRAEAAIKAYHAGEIPKYDVEFRFKRKDGDWMWIRARGKIVAREESGKPLRMVGTHADITERKHAEEEKALLEEQYHRAQKVESIGRLAGGVAHDLNNLLSPILGYGELLLNDLDTDDERRESVSEIVSAAFRARDLVRQLLAFSRKQTLEYKPLDMNKTIDGFESLLRRTIREDIEIKIVPSPDIGVVSADIGQIEQVIMNLAVNAADAMPQGGRLTIETAAADLDEHYASLHRDVKPGQYVLLAVSDNGVGMDEHIRKHLFEPFYTTKGTEGTGLGLSTVYGIVKQHDGHISVYSEPGEGTTFKIYLPEAKKSHATEKAPVKAVTNLKGSETVLLVEDNAQVRRITNSILDRQGYKILMAKNGIEALATLAAYEGPVHLLLTDVVMPNMNGRELFEKAAEKYPRLKVLYLSGYTDNVIAERGILEEGIAFIQKPFHVDALAAKIREVLGQDHDQ